MGFKKHAWMNYGSQGEIIEFIIKDGSGSNIDKFKCNNQKDYSRVIHLIKQKYGYSPNTRDELEKEQEDWIKPDEEFKW